MNSNISNLVRKQLTIKDIHDYYCLTDIDTWGVVNSSQLKAGADNLKELPAMSLRLSTGIMGELDCPAGNRGPKGADEVIVGLGEQGVNALLKLGGLPCMVCKSGSRLIKIDKSVTNSLEINTVNLENASNGEWLASHYDSRRLNWELILKLNIVPTRFYTRPGLSYEAVGQIRSMFADCKSIPAIGFYDSHVESHFTEYPN